jgi:Fe-Mn family superoxide dismutase
MSAETKLNSLTYPFPLANLPYEKIACAPYMSAETFDFHHGKHHAAYVNNLNKLVDGTELSKMTLREVILTSHKNPSMTAIFNNAAQVWNHSFFWLSITPGGGGRPHGTLLEQISKDFGSYENFAKQFALAGIQQFGSGWAWLVFDPASKALKIIKTANAELPLLGPMIPLLTCDVWEHAYYIDYRNDRAKYLDTFLKHLIDWEFAQQNFDAATRQQTA